MIGNLPAGSLNASHPQLLEKVGAAKIERCREKSYAALLAVGLDGAKGLIGQLELLDHLELGFRGARILHLVVGFGRMRSYDLFRSEGLELDNISAGFGGSIDQSQPHIQATVVVDAGFGNHQAGQSGSDRALSDLNRFYHAVHPPSTASTWPVT